MLLSREFYNLFKYSSNPFKFIKHLYTSANYGAQISFKLSDIGEGIREVTVKEWFVNVGDKVSQFDEICEVQSDKASVTITSRYDGIIKKLHYNIDEIAAVGQPLIDIETADEVSEPETPKPEVEKLEPQIQEKDESNNKEILCIPSVRRLAKEHHIDLTRIKGTGKSGRILKENVLEYLKLSSDEEVESKSFTRVTQDKTEPIKGFQKAMVKTMTNALKIPHFVYSDEVAITKLSQLRKDMKSHPEFQQLKISFMPFFIKAVSNALQRFPILNAILDENCENVTYKSEHNIGIAMDTKAGLAVPVIKNIERLSIIEISKELNRLITSGRDGTFAMQDLAGATFTLSNIGAIGGTYMKPVIMPPQVALFAIGAAKFLPRFADNGEIVKEEILCVSGVGDHRIIDGATMARFTQFFKKQIENPYLLFLNV